jgi:hypothetical protein
MHLPLDARATGRLDLSIIVGTVMQVGFASAAMAR